MRTLSFMKRRRTERGQATSEFVIMLVMTVLVALALFALLAIFSEQAWRMISLVAWEPYT